MPWRLEGRLVPFFALLLVVPILEVVLDLCD